jgi:peptide/nickel transport system ATP-binding protein
MSSTEKLLEVKHLKKFFPLSGGVFRKVLGYVRAVDDISFDIMKGR